MFNLPPDPADSYWLVSFELWGLRSLGQGVDAQFFHWVVFKITGDERNLMVDSHGGNGSISRR